MNAKDFAFLALVIRTTKILLPEWDSTPIIEAFIAMAPYTYPRFNAEKFRELAETPDDSRS